MVGLIHLQDPAWTNANVFRGLPVGSTTTGSQKIDLAGTLAISDIHVGMNISGTGIPTGATVTQVDANANAILISQAATASTQPGGTVPLTIQDPGALQPVMGQPGIWSFWRVNKFVNAYQFIDQANEWYLDRSTGKLYLALPDGTNPNSHDIQLPTLETLIQGNGAKNLSFEGLKFANATWLAPNGADGYVSDQAGFHLTGTANETNLIGHVQSPMRTPGNISFSDSTGITFSGDTFEHLGAAALDFSGGAQNNRIANNIFQDVSGSAIQIGGVSAADARPASDAGVVRNNVVDGNFIKNIGAEFYDTAGIFVGFAQNTKIVEQFHFRRAVVGRLDRMGLGAARSMALAHPAGGQPRLLPGPRRRQPGHVGVQHHAHDHERQPDRGQHHHALPTEVVGWRRGLHDRLPGRQSRRLRLERHGDRQQLRLRQDTRRRRQHLLYRRRQPLPRTEGQYLLRQYRRRLQLRACVLRLRPDQQGQPLRNLSPAQRPSVRQRHRRLHHLRRHPL